MKKRLLYHEIEKYLSHKNALLITGMRQVGKTTLMRQLFNELKTDNKLWFDFDNPLEYKLPFALVVGHESEGVAKKTLDSCDAIVEIPMHGVNKSLNVIVSAAVVAFHAYNKLDLS